MATGKRYYWIKLKETFMTSDAVDFLMGQKDGANYVVLYQMLCLKTINTDGKLERHIGEIIIPYDEAKIQRDTKYFSMDTIRIALNLYKALGLIYVDQNGTLCLTDHRNLVGSETDYAEQKRNQRSNPALPEGVDNVHRDVLESVHTDIDIRDRDKRLDIRDIDNTSDEAADFDKFWAVYPRKVSKEAARKAFAKVKEPVELLINAVEKQKQTEQWTKDGGRFIPHPATWLNQGRWEDDVEIPVQKAGTGSFKPKNRPTPDINQTDSFKNSIAAFMDENGIK